LGSLSCERGILGLRVLALTKKGCEKRRLGFQSNCAQQKSHTIMRMLFRTLPLLLAMNAVCAAAAGTECENLASLTIPNVTIKSAAMQAAGQPIRGFPQGGDSLPAFCRVEAVARPVPDSEIEFEVWMPLAAAWNGKFQGAGNGGYSGAISYSALAQALKRGYAAASHNTGHNGSELTFALGHPEKLVDYAHRAVHVMTEHAKLIVRLHLGRYAEKSYFVGCSAGGHQAIALAQRYPEDYDGIVAGAPANNRIRQTFGFLAYWLALHDDAGRPIVAAEKLPLITQAVVEACDASDGLKDGLIDDPRRCKVDLSKILTPTEEAAVRKVYAGAKNPRTGQLIFGGFPMGSEFLAGGQSWRAYLLDPKEPMRVDLFRIFLFHDPNWDYRTIDWERDLAYANEKLSFMNSNHPDLSAFRKHGGKLLLYGGWADPVVSPLDTVGYFENVQKTMGTAAAGEFVRLFMAPGMAHCGGGPGPNQFDALAAVDEWVVKGVAPAKLIAAHLMDGKVDRTRPLCAYPQVARYKGSGSIDEAANFVCAMPRP
jgi:feruloyl esterase